MLQRLGQVRELYLFNFFVLFYVMCFNRKELLKNPSVVQLTWKPDSANLPCVTVLKMLLS